MSEQKLHFASIWRCNIDASVDVTFMFTIHFQILIRNRATDLDARMYDGSTALILAARLAVEGMVEELITCHADVNAVDEIGKHEEAKIVFA